MITKHFFYLSIHRYHFHWWVGLRDTCRVSNNIKLDFDKKQSILYQMTF